MPFLQKLLMAILPRKFAERAKAESQDWMMRCPNCQREFSVWEVGGIRYKTAGNSKLLMWCPGCNQRVWDHVYRKSLKPQSTSGKVE